jgi:hypothetical protein
MDASEIRQDMYRRQFEQSEMDGSILENLDQKAIAYNQQKAIANQYHEE